VEHLLDAFGIHCLLGLVGKALAVGGLVVHERDLLALEIGGDVVAGDCALLVVAAAGAKNVPHVALGDARIGGGRGDLQDAVLLVDFGGRHGYAGVEMPDHELHAGGGKIVGDRDALLGVGDVVAVGDRNLLAEDAAGLVHVGDRLLGAILELGAEGSLRAGKRSADAESDGIAAAAAAAGERKTKTGGKAERDQLV